MQARDAGLTKQWRTQLHAIKIEGYPSLYFSQVIKKKCLIPQANQEFEWSFTKDKTLPMYIGCLHCTYRIYSTLLPPPNNAFLMKIFSLLFLFQTSNKVLVFLNSWASI